MPPAERPWSDPRLAPSAGGKRDINRVIDETEKVRVVWVEDTGRFEGKERGEDRNLVSFSRDHTPTVHVAAL